MKRRWFAGVALGVVALLCGLWLGRALLAAKLAEAYFRSHGVESAVHIEALGLSGISARFALGPSEAPGLSAGRIVLHLDSAQLLPRVTEVELADAVVRAQLTDDGRILLSGLQDWIESLSSNTGRSRFVSDDLAVSFTHLRALVGVVGRTVTIEGDARLVKNLPVRAAFALHPVTLDWRGNTVALRAARLDYDKAAGTLVLHYVGDLHSPAIVADGLDVRLTADGFVWNGPSFGASSIHANVSARALDGVAQPRLDVLARDPAFAFDDHGGWRGGASVTVTGQGDPPSQLIKMLAKGDAALAGRIAANLAHLNLAFAARVTARNRHADIALTAPLVLRGAKGAVLTVSRLAGGGWSGDAHGDIAVRLEGSGLPRIDAALQNAVFSNGVFTAATTLAARFDIAQAHGADARAQGLFAWRGGTLSFRPSACAPVTMASLRGGAIELAQHVQGRICADGSTPLLTVDAKGWRFNGEARDIAAMLPLANVALAALSARLAFEGAGASLAGHVNAAGVTVTDRTPAPRFTPLHGGGDLALGAGVWHGAFALTDPRDQPLGRVTITHTMANGAGTAHIDLPSLAFAPDRLQPVALSPLLAPLRQANGVVRLAGDVGWGVDGVTSHGTLAIDRLDFLTPLGRAHALKTKLDLVSLLPPATAAHQSLAIARIDWTVPLSGVNLNFSLAPPHLALDAAAADIAEGHVTLSPIALDLTAAATLDGAARLSAVAFAPLLAASNLGSRVKLDGHVSGTIPFHLTPEGFRIVDGHLAADGPGRLSIDRSLWAQGGAVSANAVQDFAYQALEYLAFDSLTADLNSVANGRLQVVFHVKGRSDPPKPQTADVAIADLINGTALQKSIPLPSGTPIDLTLDTSLNFDELLKSYAEAWSNMLRPAGAADTARGATP